MLPAFRKHWGEIATSLTTLDFYLNPDPGLAHACRHYEHPGELCVRCLDRDTARTIIDREENVMEGALRLSALAERIAPALPVHMTNRSTTAREASESIRAVAFQMGHNRLLHANWVPKAGARAVGDMLDYALADIRSAGLIRGWRESDRCTALQIAMDESAAVAMARWKKLSTPERVELLQRAMPSVVDVLRYVEKYDRCMENYGGCDEDLVNFPFEMTLIATRLGIEPSALVDYTRNLRHPIPFESAEHRATAQAVHTLDVEPTRTSFHVALADGYTARGYDRVIDDIFSLASQMPDRPPTPASMPAQAEQSTARSTIVEQTAQPLTDAATLQPGENPLIVTAAYLHANATLKPTTLAKGAKKGRWNKYKTGNENAYHLNELIPAWLDADDRSRLRELREKLDSGTVP